MKFDEHLEAELGRVFSSIQIDEDRLYTLAGQGQQVQTRAPFFSVRTLDTEYFVVLHGADVPPPAQTTGPSQGGLSSWQLRRAKQIMAVHRRPALSIAEVAQACGVTESHFVREFKRSTGITPHRWAMTQRVATARSLLLHTRLSLERIAAGSGFFDPSHLTRWFKRLTGESPRAWQRAHMGTPNACSGSTPIPENPARLKAA
ncbi:helix-turn-helix domain-containing protein [Pararobbsia alpina]|uniref:helix-turn-helix domain-containing protein n=1 Tax=Pararobbsia alpina TaxID=621374 RepID=UPI0039A6D04E